MSDRSTGNLYVVYQTRVSGSPRIVFTKSTDKGDIWSAPIPISDNPSGTAVFNPAINASPDGKVLTVAFYDGRDNAGSNTLVDMYLVQSFDRGATWQPNIRLTSVSTDASLAPLKSSGYMLGDYLGIAESTNANVPAVPVWIDTRTGNPDPFITRVGIAPQVNFTSWQAARLSFAQINQPGVGGPGDDADHDGEDNLSEFQSLTDPNDPNSVVRSARDLNISTRARVETGDNVVIGGFIVGGGLGTNGDGSAKIVVRGMGPSLTQAGVPVALQDPTIELHDGNGTTIGANDDWRQNQANELQMAGLAPGDDRESAILTTLTQGNYTAILRGKTNMTGVGLVEVYNIQ